jgi:penicillin-binding protein 2
MSHILGYVGQINPSELEDDANTDRLGNPLYQADDLIGKDGLEATMEQRLRGRPGFRMMELNPAGGPVRVVEGTEVAPEPGKNLTLTIDLELQRAVSQILQEGIRFSNEDRRIIGERDPKRPYKKASGAGSVVAIDPRNGEVLAMVSYPHYDNQLFVDGISDRKYKEYVSDLANKPLVDRALRVLYPPGSTLKPFMAAAALHEKTLDTTKTYTCTGAIQVPYAWDASKGNPHPCWQLAGHGALDVYEAIEQSCDVFFYNVAAPRQQIENSEEFLHYMEKDPIRNIIDSTKHYFEGMGIKAIKENLEGRFWFGQPTTIDLPGEAEGLVPDDPWKRRTQAGGWSVGDTINVSIGQGFFLTTPLQLALNTVALANKGTIHRPLLIREAFDDPKQDVERFVGKVLRKVDIAAEHLDVAREGMRRVVRAQSTNPNPTGKSKWVLSNPPGQPEIVIGGKTGTAEIGEADENGLYDRQHAVFTAFAPYDDPEIAIAVIVEDGGEGSTYAVPVADRVIRAFFELSGKRPRGTVLRADGLPDDPTQSVLAEGAAFPEPGINAVPGALPQD